MKSESKSSGVVNIPEIGLPTTPKSVAAKHPKIFSGRANGLTPHERAEE